MSNSPFDTDAPEWRQSPRSRDTFRDIGKVLKTVPIRRGSDSTPLGEKSISTNDVKVKNGEGYIDWKTFLETTSTDGIIILHKGEVLVEQYLNNNDVSTRHIIFSITKSVVGLIVGILQNQGKIDPDSPIVKYIPEIADVPPFGKCTLRHLLDMRTGTTVDDAYKEYGLSTGWRPTEGDPPTMHEFILSLRDASHKQPGEGPFEYHSINTDILGWCVERATGKRLANLISELLWQPMGAEYDASITVDKADNPRAAGGMSTSLRDLARMGQVVARKGGGIVPEAWIDDMLHNGDVKAFSKGAWVPAFGDAAEHMAYRSCWLCDGRRETAMGFGIHGQMLFVDFQNDLVLAKTSSRSIAADFSGPLMALQALEQIKTMLHR